MKCARAKPKGKYLLNVEKQPVIVSDGAFLEQKPQLSTYPRKKGYHGVQCFCCVTVNIIITINFICCAGWYTSKNFKSIEKP